MICFYCVLVNVTNACKDDISFIFLTLKINNWDVITNPLTQRYQIEITRLISIMSKPISFVVVIVVVVVVQKKLGPKMGSILGSILGFNIGFNIRFNIGFQY